MIPIHRRLTLQTYKVANLFGVAVATIIAFKCDTILRYGWGVLWPILYEMIPIWQLAAALFYLTAWHFCFSVMELYKYHRKLFSYDIAVDQFFATTLGTCLLGPFLYFLVGAQENPALFLGVIWGISFTLGSLARVIPWIFFRRIHLGNLQYQHVAIIGYNKRAQAFVERIRQNQELGYKLTAVFDNDETRTAHLSDTDFSFIGKIEELPAYLRDNVVDHIAIFLPLKSQYDEASWVVRRCQEHGVIVLFPSSIFDTQNGIRLDTEQGDVYDQMVTFQYNEGDATGWRYTVKYTLDFLCALAGLIILSPFFFLIAVLIRLTSTGPAFFLQTRIGVNGRRFEMYKFRTMVTGAEQQINMVTHLNEMDGPVFKIKNDPRITRLGRTLRRWSIDEFPQLINVLKGEMSLVGPRAMSLRDFDEFYDDKYRRRFSVRPGLTCLWQISGRSTLSFEQWMQLDLDYIDKWSLGKDFEILLRTIPAVLKGTGAH